MSILVFSIVGLAVIVILLVIYKRPLQKRNNNEFRDIMKPDVVDSDCKEVVVLNKRKTELISYYDEQQGIFVIPNAYKNKLKSDALIIEGSRKTPTVLFDISKGVLEITGCSSPQDSVLFYEQLFPFIDDYAKAAKPLTYVNILVKYINTGSTKCFQQIFKKMENIHQINQGVTINWFYDEGDEDMLDVGHDFETIVRIPFKFIEVSYK